MERTGGIEEGLPLFGRNERDIGQCRTGGLDVGLVVLVAASRRRGSKHVAALASRLDEGFTVRIFRQLHIALDGHAPVVDVGTPAGCDDPWEGVQEAGNEFSELFQDSWSVEVKDFDATAADYGDAFVRLALKPRCKFPVVWHSGLELSPGGQRGALRPVCNNGNDGQARL